MVDPTILQPDCHSRSRNRHPLPEVVIWRAIRRYKLRRATEQIKIKDKWLFDVAVNGQVSKYHWPLLMHTPATLARFSHFLEDLGARRENSSAHARILILGLLLSGLRPQGQTPLIHDLAHCMAQLCDEPDSISHRAMFISLYPRVCQYILQRFDSVLLEIRSAASWRRRQLAPPQPLLRHAFPPAAAGAAAVHAPKEKFKREVAEWVRLPLFVAFLTSILRYILMFFMIFSN